MSSCDQLKEFEKRAETVNGYEVSALRLAQENRELRAKNYGLQFKIEGLESKNNFLKIQLDKRSKKIKRSVASIPLIHPSKDLVKFDIYKWKSDQVMAIAHKEFQKKNYEKSAQFFQTYLKQFPNKNVNDELLFQAGMASFESGNHHRWTIDNMNKLIKEYPTSKFYRGAKLWMGLTHLKMGKKDDFFATVEEFRLKYRNTTEWEILSAHYEKILQKYKK